MSPLTGGRPAWGVAALGLGLWANRWHFRQVRQRVAAVLRENPEAKALAVLRDDSPISHAGWLIPAAVLGALLSWAMTVHDAAKPSPFVRAPQQKEATSPIA